MPNLSWSDCHIDWSGVDTVARVVHIPSRVYISPGEVLVPSADRRHLLDALAAELKKPEGERNTLPA